MKEKWTGRDVMIVGAAIGAVIFAAVIVQNLLGTPAPAPLK